MLLSKQAVIFCYIFLPHLINASALPCETENTEIVSFQRLLVATVKAVYSRPMRITSRRFPYKIGRKSATKFLYVKTVSDRVVRHSLA